MTEQEESSNVPPAFKELLLEDTQKDRWTELVFTTGGTSSMLHDIQILAHSGGYCFKRVSGRFLYWRANKDVLELIEHSLRLPLRNNQLRYRFEGTQILDGITVFEEEENVIILVPTVCTVHKLVFPKPSSNELCESYSLSIFAEASIKSLRDPRLYGFFDTTPTLPHTAASTLNYEQDALFCFALNNSSLLLLSLQNQVGVRSQIFLKLDSGVPRFFAGLTEVFRGGTKKPVDNIAISIEMCAFAKDTYIIALSNIAELRVWSCTKHECVNVTNTVPPGDALSAGVGRRCIIKKAVVDHNLLLAVYLPLELSSRILIYQVVLEDGFHLKVCKELHTPGDQDLVTMTLECEGRLLWCIWRSRDSGETKTSAIVDHSGKWVQCVECKPNFEPEMETMFPESVIPSEYYSNLIFSPGRFSISTILRILNLIRAENPFERPSKLALQEKVWKAIETNVENEIRNTDTSEEFVEVAKRHWDQFYMNCLQCEENDRHYYGLVWISSSSLLACMTKNSTSFFTAIDTLENDILFGANSTYESYHPLLQTLQLITFSVEQKARLSAIEAEILQVNSVMTDIAFEIALDSNIQRAVSNLMKYVDLKYSVKQLLNHLQEPDHSEDNSISADIFKGYIGSGLVVTAAFQIISLRLEIAYKFLVLLLILKNNKSLDDAFEVGRALEICQTYAILKWCSVTYATGNEEMLSILHLIFDFNQELHKKSILDCVRALCTYLWYDTNNLCLPQFLLQEKQYILIQEYARLSNFHSDNYEGNLILLRSYLETCEPQKAYNLIPKETNPEHIMNIIPLFERLEYSSYVIRLTETAISSAKPDFIGLPRLYSILFMHNLKLGNYIKAYDNINKNPDETRRMDCLKELIVTLMNANEIDQLFEFHYNGTFSHVEQIIIKRARSLQPPQAYVYYQFLYCFYIKTSDYRKAASVMFEQGYRAQTNELKKQCYATCLSCLSFVQPAFAWILKPKDNSDTGDEMLEMLEIKDVRREFELAAARCQLQNCHVDLPPQQVVSSLKEACLYQTALRVAHLCKVDLEPIFAAFAAKCVGVKNSEKSRVQDPWSWLIPNNVSDYVSGDNDPLIVAWRLLEYLLKEYEEEHLSTLHKVVANVVLSLKEDLPPWLELSYQKINTPELLRLYVEHKRFEKAAELCLQLFSSLIAARGSEDPESGVCWIPWNIVDRLLIELEEQTMNDQYNKVEAKIKEYISSVVKLTKSKAPMFQKSKSFM